MRLRPTDFYLNLDRWESLAALERERGRWEERREGPRPRLDAIQREATIEAAWELTSPGVPLDRRVSEAIARPGPALAGDTLARARTLHRALVFVHGWYPAFSWSSTGLGQICRLLEEPEGPGLDRALSQLLHVRHIAQVVREQTVSSDLIELAAYQGGLAHLAREDRERRHLYLLGLRILALQAGYVQVLFAPIEPVWLAARSGGSGSLLPPPWVGSDELEDRLGSWLDEVVEDLLEVGRRAEEKWERHRTIAARSALQESILTIAGQNGRVTAGEILRTTGANRNTVKDNLARLVESGLLARRGSKRGTVYLPV